MTAMREDGPQTTDQVEKTTSTENKSTPTRQRRTTMEMKAMSTKTRRYAETRRKLARRLPMEDLHLYRSTVDQYHIPPPDDGNSLCGGLGSLASTSLMDFILWQFKTTMLNALFTFLIIYIVLVMFFSTIIYGIIEGVYQRRDGVECLSTWEPGNAAYNFEMSFGLSWTTFSTVGFGTISPSDDQGCYLLRYATAIEAYLGVLFAGYSTAIIFAKVSRVLKRASITFSSTICVEYGDGVEEETRGQPIDMVEQHSSPNTAPRKPPYPVVEFRIVNDRANQRGGEILNASVSCIVFNDIDPAAMVTSSDRASTTSSDRQSSAVIVDDDSGANERVWLPKRKFQSMSIQTSFHPSLRKVWYVRHILNDKSPLVKSHVKRRIRELGHWPSELNDHASVRSSLVEFNDIIVTFSGTSTITASEVFAEKIYKFKDVHVGWQFSGVMYHKKQRNGEQKLRVDHRLIHDILPQSGGGNEPLSIEE